MRKINTIISGLALTAFVIALLFSKPQLKNIQDSPLESAIQSSEDQSPVSIISEDMTKATKRNIHEVKRSPSSDIEAQDLTKGQKAPIKRLTILPNEFKRSNWRRSSGSPKGGLKDMKPSQSRAEHILAKRKSKQNGVSRPIMKQASLEFARMKKERMTPADLDQPAYGLNYLIDAYNRAASTANISRADDGVLFTERGPSNVGGRTRGFFVDPRDSTSNTWLAASVTGGIWKTMDGGQTWMHLTNDLPNIIFSWLAVSEVNPDIIYASSGESFAGFDGSGLFKSEDGGASWFQVANPETNPDFRTVNRVVVHPENPDIVLAATNSTLQSFQFRTRSFAGFQGINTAIYKTTDGGMNWTRVYSAPNTIIEDLDINPFDSNTLYATQNNEGILISEDGGDSWELNSAAFVRQGRIEIAPSTVDENRLWASAEGTGRAVIFVSDDKGRSWGQVDYAFNKRGFDILGGQGFYDNIIVPHPFDNDQVYVGGVDLFKLKLDTASVESTGLNLSQLGTAGFLRLIDFSGDAGGIAGYGSIDPDSLPTIELRFGQGGQKAHRFTVGSQGGGVPLEDYVYRDYIDVPFQAWDLDNERQLMLSFRDQATNGRFDLIPDNISGNPFTHSRENIFIHLLDYDTLPNDSISAPGGIEYRHAYDIWPVSASNMIYDLDTAPASSLLFEQIMFAQFGSDLAVLSDAYYQFDSTNNFQLENVLAGRGNHPDQHNIWPDIVSEQDSLFRLIVSNDGGVYVTEVDSNPGEKDVSFTFMSGGYNTTQFYGADKAPGVNRYVGGTQDNSTWYSPEGSPDGVHDFSFAFPGDGFEAAWNNRNPDIIFGSIQFNSIQFTFDGFQSGSFDAIAGMEQDAAPSSQSQFYTKIAYSKKLPDYLFAVGASGIWRSAYYPSVGSGDPYGEYATLWSLADIEGAWAYTGSNTDVEVSLANPSIVYAGGFLNEEFSIARSFDAGLNFGVSGLYDDITMGTLSGIESHPTNERVVYTLFSFAERPKILRSMDYGETWEDISGFIDGDGKSTRGFPDVAVNCLFVFPNDTNRIWVGSDIGIIESIDNGMSWNFLDCELGAASVYDFKLQDDQIVIASYGRGIWTATIENFDNPNIISPDILSLVIDPAGFSDSVIISIPQVFDSLHVQVNRREGIMQTAPAAGIYTYALDAFDLEANNEILVSGYLNGIRYSSHLRRWEHIILDDVITQYTNDFEDESTISDFASNGFEINRAEDFESKGLQTQHAYERYVEYTCQLKNPILIQDQILSYDDVAIIEPGEDTAVFGDQRFYDYVIVEGAHISSPGEWQPIVGGYDASLSPEWLQRYQSRRTGSQDIEVFHSADLSSIFSPGDTILIRFRLFSDIFVNGWGWHIDNFNIESVTTNNDEKTDEVSLSVYPNPANSEFSWSGMDISKIALVQVFDIKGALVQRWEGSQLSSNTVNTSSWPQGTYLLDFQLKTGQRLNKKIQVVR